MKKKKKSFSLFPFFCFFPSKHISNEVFYMKTDMCCFFFPSFSLKNKRLKKRHLVGSISDGSWEGGKKKKKKKKKRKIKKVFFFCFSKDTSRVVACLHGYRSPGLLYQWFLFFCPIQPYIFVVA